MAKDLTEALQSLTERASGQTSRVDKALPARPNPPAIPARTGSAGPVYASGTGQVFALDGEKTYTSSDGLFTIVFPDSLRGFVGTDDVTWGVMTVDSGG